MNAMSQHGGSRRRDSAVATVLLVVWAALPACAGDIMGLEEQLTPLGHIPVQITGDLGQFLPPGEDLEGVNLRVALVWAAVPEPDLFCVEHGSGLGLPVGASVTAVVDAGCRDIFGFVAGQVGEGAAVGPDGKATLDLLHLPTGEVLVGPPEGRVGYAGVVVYDDREDDGTLSLRRARRHFKPGSGDDFGPGDGPPPEGRGNRGFNVDIDVSLYSDFVYGGSFISMMQAHTRVAFREGQLGPTAQYFYPTLGCPTPASGFSTISVGGTPIKAVCVSGSMSTTEVSIPLRATPDVAELACGNAQTRYRDTEREADLEQPWHCVDANQLVVANPPGLCKGLTSFLLRGCRKSADCKEPDWDDSDKPPDWWPCGTPDFGKDDKTKHDKNKEKP